MARKSKKPSPEALEAQADIILANSDRQMLADILENSRALIDGLAELHLPSNDPTYLERLQKADRDRSEIANHIAQIDIVPDGNKSYLGVGSFQHHEARALAELLSGHFEAKIRQHE